MTANWYHWSSNLEIKQLVFLLFISAGVCVAGCGKTGPALYPVSGKVEFSDGSPAMFGSIEFRSDSESPVIARGKIQKDGSFSARSVEFGDGMVEGVHNVRIEQVIGSFRQGSVVHHHGLEVAKKYRSYRTTDLEVEVTPKGENRFTLLVDSKE